MQDAIQEETFSTRTLDRLIVLGENNTTNVRAGGPPTVRSLEVDQNDMSDNPLQAESSRGEKSGVVPGELSGE